MELKPSMLESKIHGNHKAQNEKKKIIKMKLTQDNNTYGCNETKRILLPFF